MQMICKPCKQAGQQVPFLPNAAPVLSMLHKKCKGGNWCDCHHEITKDALNASRKEA